MRKRDARDAMVTLSRFQRSIALGSVWTLLWSSVLYYSLFIDAGTSPFTEFNIVLSASWLCVTAVYVAYRLNRKYNVVAVNA